VVNECDLLSVGAVGFFSSVETKIDEIGRMWPGMRCESASNTRANPLREDTIPHTTLYVILHTSQYAIYGFHCFSLFFTHSNDGLRWL
jgi:hypothetical protein